MPNRSLHRFAILVSACTLLLLMIGSCATDNRVGSPLASGPYSQRMPFFDPCHEMLAATTGILTFALAIFISRAENRAWLRQFAWAVAAVFALEVLLGLPGLFGPLPGAVSLFHALLGPVFFAGLVALAVFTSPGWSMEPEPVPDSSTPSLRSLAIATPALVMTQILLGACFRHRVLGVMPHMLGALVITLLIVLVGVLVLQQYPTHRFLRPAAVALIVITGIQIFLGLTAYLILVLASTNLLPGMIVGAIHSANGTLTLAASIVLALQIRRHVRQTALEQTPSATPAIS